MSIVKFRYILLFLFSINSNHALSQNSTDLDKYFDHLKRLEFVDARDALLNVKNETVKQALLDLTLVLEHQGQKYDYKDFTYFVKKPSSPRDSLLTCIRLLTQSNAEIAYNKLTERTFTKLTEALDIGKNLGNRPLIKQILLGILSLFRTDIIQFSKGEYFLNEYKNYADDLIDYAHYTISNFIFESKTDADADKVFDHNAYLMDSAFMHIDKSSKLIPLYLFEKGIYYGILDLYQEAITSYDSVLRITPKVPCYRYIHYGAYLKLSEIAAKRGNFEKAFNLLEQTKVHKDLSLPEISDYYYYSYGSRYYDRAGNRDQALAFLRRANSLLNQINKLNIINNRNQAAIAYETFQKEKRILEQEKELLQEKELQTKSRNISLVLGITLFLSVIIVFLLYRNNKRQQQLAVQEKDIQKQKVANLLKEQELATIDAIIAGQEKERQRVANELHDDLGSLMATIKLHFDNIKTGRTDTSLKTASNLLEEAYQKIRGMAHTRNSGVMANKGLVPAVHKMAQTISETNKIKLEVNDFGMDERLENSLELSIFRIIQELTTNMIKHAKATKGSIQLTQHENNLNIIVEDNGKGFDMSGIERTKRGMGLGTIEKRIEHLEGSFTVDSVLGKGTSVIIDIPV